MLMEKKWVTSSIFISVALILFYLVFQNRVSKEIPDKKDTSYFHVIPISQWTPGNCPCLPIQIESCSLSPKLDLGFQGQLSIDCERLLSIDKKKYLGSKEMHGFKGRTYQHRIFEIAEMQIGCMSFHHSLVQEENKNFHIDNSSLENKEHAITPLDGRIGWELFQTTNLFLDLSKDRIACCDSLSSLRDHGYMPESFSKAPLISERGLIEIEVKTENGPLKCILDTGCTFNVLNMALSKECTFDDAVWDLENRHTFSAFQIASQEFGPISLHRLPINLPIKIEAILGMEFFLENMVFIDFANNLVYIAPSKSDPSSEPTAEIQVSEVNLID